MNKISDAARIEVNAYMKRWRAANKDKMREANQRYWERKAQRRLKEQVINGKTDDQR